MNVMAALGAGHADQNLMDTKIGTIRNGVDIASSFSVRGVLADSDKVVFGITRPITSDQLDIEFNLLFEREDILDSLEWVELWSHANIAIEKGYYSSISATERKSFRLSPYKTGPKFIESIKNNGLHAVSGRVKSIYETCALVICGRAKELAGINPRPLRGAGRADGAKPMRADISQEGTGFRLHYWHCSDGTVELSCVNVHNDYKIY
jgi:hypothetical protein